MLREALRRSMEDAPPRGRPRHARRLLRRPRRSAQRPPRRRAGRPPASLAHAELRVELDAGAGRHEHPGRLCIDSRLVSLRFTLRAPAGWIANTGG